MKPVFLMAAVASLVLNAVAVSVLPAADKPRLPVARTDDKPAEGKVRLGGAIDFTPPEGWIVAKQATTPTRAAYVSADKQAMMSVEVLPASMKIEPDLAAAMTKKMRQNRQANAQKFVTEPTVEKDDNFVIRIRERYQIKTQVADQLHLYRAVGPRFLLVTINSLAGEDNVKAHHDAGVSTSMSAQFVNAGK
ncbi:hypothetical protein [Humisphaera borealis]|uniref:PsbP C-terminal domain-containing protein n=1 Tax=Humisphaera borealis TaxID=2807512 RepID=A0A7M2WTX1_9BACT|nr:hypothetical protein [Humisphaera borealis]QOV88602.1 hypothetical protein IPV69_20525 [Humisphaera borealis]